MTELLTVYGNAKQDLRRIDEELQAVWQAAKDNQCEDLATMLNDLRFELQKVYIRAADGYDFWHDEIVAHNQEG